MSYQVSYKSESIKLLQRQIDVKGNELKDTLTTILNETKEMEKIYDSPTGKIFREKFIEYLQSKISFIDEKYLSLNNLLNIVLKEYAGGHSDVNKMVGGK